MNSSIALSVLLMASICLLGCTDAWGFGRRSGGSSGGSLSSRWSSRRNSTSKFNGTSVIGVRRVDELHPYFRSYEFNRSSTKTLNSLKQSLGEFFNQSGNITWLVKNDRLLMSRDADVLKLKYNDQIEVWFTNSGAPTRARTAYAFSKDARKMRWSRKDKEGKDKSGRGKDKSKDRRDRMRSRTESLEEEDEDQFDIDMDYF